MHHIGHIDTYSASLPLKTTWELMDKDGNVIAEQIEVQADFEATFNGDSMGYLSANGVQIEVHKAVEGDMYEGIWVDLPEFLQEPFEQWLKLPSTEMWFSEQVADQDTYEG